MRILCLPRSPLKYFGGISIYCLHLYENLDLNVKCYSYDIENKIKKIIKRNVGGVYEEVFPSELNYGTLSISIRYFLRIINSTSNFDIIHTQHPDPFSALAVIFAKIRKPSIKIFTTWHAEVYKSYLFFAPFLLIIDLILFSLSEDLIYFTPYHVKSSLLSKVPLFKKKITLIPNTLDTDKILNFKNRKYEISNIEKKEYVDLLSVGRLVSYKGYEYALEALSMLGQKYRYRIIGKGPLYGKLKKLIEKYQLQDRVILLGALSNKQKYEIFNNSDIFLFPSVTTSEAYGLAQIEAMCFDLPIINTKLNNGVNFLVPEKYGITCKPKSSVDLKDAILKLTLENKTYQMMCQRSVENLKRFSIEEMTTKYQNLMLKYFS